MIKNTNLASSKMLPIIYSYIDSRQYSNTKHAHIPVNTFNNSSGINLWTRFYSKNGNILLHYKVQIDTTVLY